MTDWKSLVCLNIAIATAALGHSGLALAQEGGGPRVLKPTAGHKIVTADEGTWDATVTIVHRRARSPAEVSKGVEVNTVLAGGLWLVSRFEGDFGGAAVRGARAVRLRPGPAEIRRDLDRLDGPES